MKLIRYFVVIASLIFCGTTFAALSLELTQGVNGAIPISIIPFAGQSDSQSPDNIAAVVSNDLQNSGRFNVMKSTKQDHQPSSASTVDFNYWQKQNVNDLVVGSTKQLASGQVQVHFQLLDIFVNKNATLLDQTFTINANQSRGLAHHISDLIYQRLTGVRGVFSTRIAYVLVKQQNGKPYQYSLDISDIDGYSPTPLLISNQPIMSPTWSPDGSQIAYVSFEGGHAAIYLQSVSTGKRKIVTDFQGINGAPAFSPDGKKLAVVLTKTGYPKLYTIDLASGKPTQITQGWSIDTEPNWAPDGKSLIFTSNRGGGPQIYRVDLATRRVSRVTFDGSYNATASFTPDGKSIIMLHRSGGLFNVAMQDLTTGRVTLLTQNGQDQSPSLAPNGRMVVYATHYGGRGILAMVSTDDKVKLRLPARSGNVREPVWSPFLGG